ncbi:MAG: mechanosensitive ion channel family protein [Spirulinaceae cyanobacterium]
MIGVTILLISVSVNLPPSRAQEEVLPVPTVPTPATESETTPDSGSFFFADVMVRGQPTLQVGSLAEISARERAEIISRRIASLLRQSPAIDPVTVELDAQQQVARLQVNNRLLMTVTQQDAQDFDVSVSELAEQWADRLDTALDQSNLAVTAWRRLTGTLRQSSREAIAFLPALLGATVIALITWIVARGVRRVALIWAENTEGDRSTEILIGRLGYGGIWVIGSILTLGVLGLDFATLLGTLGLTSVAIGFSLKDVLSNYISGVILLAARPFRIDDQVKIEEYEGTVVQIQLRATTMRTYDGRLVYIPNQQVFQSSITNNTASPFRRSDVMVGIDYDADLSTARRLIFETVRQVEGIEAEPPPLVLVEELAASTVNLKVRFWVNSRQQSFLQVTSAVTQAIKEQLERAKIEMPTDIYTLTFRDLPPELPTPSPGETA